MTEKMKKLRRLLEKGRWEPGQVIFWVQEVVDDALTAHTERIVGKTETWLMSNTNLDVEKILDLKEHIYLIQSNK